jgi:hypothetical protein
MSSLQAVFNAVEARLLATMGELGEKLPNMGLGEKAKFKSEAPPRIVWVPLQGPARRARQAGGDGLSNPNQLWERDLVCQARIWHDDIQQVEDLANHFVAALHDVLSSAAHKVIGEDWNTSSDLQRGTQMILTFSLQLPFTEEPSATAVPTGAPITGTILPAGDP